MESSINVEKNCENCYWSVWARNEDKIDLCNYYEIPIVELIEDCDDWWGEYEDEEA